MSMLKRFRTLFEPLARSIAVLLIFTSAATAQSLSFQTSDNEFTSGNARLKLIWDADLKLFSMLGEPVVSTRFRYRFNEAMTYVSLPALDGTNGYFTTSLSKLPAAGRERAQLFNVKVAYRFATQQPGQSSIYLVSDVGDPGKPDGRTWSFNVPGSPDWGRLFTRGEPTGSYLSAAEAKAAFSAGLRLVEARILSYEFTEFDLHNWYRENTRWPEVMATLKAYNYLADAVRRSTGLNPPRYDGLNVNSMAHTVKDDVLADHEKWLRNFRAKYEKLLNLPEEFKAKGNPQPYETALLEAPAIISRARGFVQGWRSSDVDPASLPKGYSPKGALPNTRLERVEVSPGFVQWAAFVNGERQERLYDLEEKGHHAPFMFSRFVIRPIYSDCEPILQGGSSYGCEFDVFLARTGKVDRNDLYPREKKGIFLNEYINHPERQLEPDRTLRYFIQNGGGGSWTKIDVPGVCTYGRHVMVGDEIEYDENLHTISRRRAKYEYFRFDDKKPAYDDERCKFPHYELKKI